MKLIDKTSKKELSPGAKVKFKGKDVYVHSVSADKGTVTIDHKGDGKDQDLSICNVDRIGAEFK